MNTQQLLCFLQVAEKLNFTRAAEELYLSTPTVTHHIKSLEEELQAQLFIRSKKSVRLSEAGLIFYNDAQSIISQFDSAKHRVEKMDHKRQSILRIGLSSNTGLFYLTKILEVLHTEYPHVYPHPIIANYAQLMHMLNDRQLDVVFGTRDMLQPIHNYTFKTIRMMHSYALIAKSNPLHKQNTVSFEDLSNSLLILLHPKMIPFKYGDNLQENIRIHSHIHQDFICENDQACVVLASANYGIAILPEFCIPNNLDDYGIVKVPLELSDPIDYGIVYPSKNKDEYIKSFIQLCSSIS